MENWSTTDKLTGILVIITGIYTLVTSVMVWYSRRTLCEQQKITKAAIYQQLRRSWVDIDNFMLQHSHCFRENNDIPTQGLITKDRLFNEDERLYVMYRLLGLAEEHILLAKRHKFLDQSYLASIDGSIEALMGLPTAQEFWKVLKKQYPGEVVEYIDELMVSSGGPA
jgi:hypothetical protein